MAEPHFSLGKLIRVERSINIYTNRKHPNIIKEIKVDHIPIEKLREIVTPNQDDPLLYDGYILDKTKLKKFNSYLTEEISFDGRTHYCVLECHGIYEKNNSID